MTVKLYLGFLNIKNADIENSKMLGKVFEKTELNERIINIMRSILT